VITSFCQFVHFFGSRRLGEQWVKQHPGTFLLSLREAFELVRISNRRFATALRRSDTPVSKTLASHGPRRRP
jgi:hypothetical protein